MLRDVFGQAMVCVGDSQIPNWYVEDLQPISETHVVLVVQMEESPVCQGGR
jgi:hypothetical protein